MNYIAVLRPDPEQRYHIRCPDFPAIRAMACNLGVARLLAEAAVQIHVEEMQRSGIPLPEPSALHDVLDPCGDADAIVVMVDANPHSAGQDAAHSMLQPVLAGLTATASAA